MQNMHIDKVLRIVVAIFQINESTYKQNQLHGVNERIQ